MGNVQVSVLWAPEESPRPVSEVVPLVGESMAVLESLADGPVVWTEKPSGQVAAEDLGSVLEGWTVGRPEGEVSGHLSASRPGLQFDPQVRGLVGTLDVFAGTRSPYLSNSVQVSVDEARSVAVDEVEEVVVGLATLWGADEVVWQVPQGMEIEDALGLPRKHVMPGWVTWVSDGVEDPFAGGRVVGGGVLHRFAELPEGVTVNVVRQKLRAEGGVAGA